MAANPLVETTGLTKRFGPAVALSDLTLRIEPGEVFGYLGPNGAGKTTTLRLLLGLLRPTAGSATVCGHDTWSDSVAVRRCVGYLPGEAALYPRLTGRDHVEYAAGLRGVRTPPRAAALAERLELDLARPARELSKGNRQKLALVLALMVPVDLLVLDEPSGGLDPIAQQEFHRLVREHVADGGSVLLSSHVLSEVQRVADRVGVLRGGVLVAVERLEDLRSRSLHHVDARVQGRVEPEELQGVRGLIDLEVSNGSLRCKAPEDALDEIVKVLARHTVIDLSCSEAELEETFLTYYAGGDGHAALRVPQDAA